jgi:protein SCO1/2
MKRVALLSGVVLVFCACPSWAEDAPNPPDVGIDQKLNAQVPLELEFQNEAGRTVRLEDCIDGKPTILVLAYYRCPMLCTQVLNGLVHGLKGVPFNAGDKFNVVAVSFDAREKPELAARKKSTYVEDYGRPGADQGWHFLTGEQSAIDALAEAVGFRYRYDKERDQFAHGSGILILTPQGRVSRYFYGIDFGPLDLRLGLVDASEKRIGSPVDRVLLLCYGYDPNTGKYTPLAMGLLRFGAALTLLGLVAGVGLAWRREWHRGRRGAAGGSPAAPPAV